MARRSRRRSKTLLALGSAIGLVVLVGATGRYLTRSDAQVVSPVPTTSVPGTGAGTGTGAGAGTGQTTTGGTVAPVGGLEPTAVVELTAPQDLLAGFTHGSGESASTAGTGDETAVRAAIDQAFKGSYTTEQHVDVVRGGAALAEVTARARAKSGFDLSSVVPQVDLLRFYGDKAAFRVGLVSGGRIIASFQGTAVKIDGTWYVSRSTWCYALYLLQSVCPADPDLGRYDERVPIDFIGQIAVNTNPAPPVLVNGGSGGSGG